MRQGPVVRVTTNVIFDLVSFYHEGFVHSFSALKHSFNSIRRPTQMWHRGSTTGSAPCTSGFHFLVHTYRGTMVATWDTAIFWEIRFKSHGGSEIAVHVPLLFDSGCSSYSAP